LTAQPGELMLDITGAILSTAASSGAFAGGASQASD
jgi:hypothetical protein